MTVETRHKAGPRSDCPAAVCRTARMFHDAAPAADPAPDRYAERSERLVWVSHVPPSATGGPFEVLYLDVTDMHAELRASGIATEIAIFKPSDALLEALVLVATGEIARRAEARAQGEGVTA